jgi:hypothetical protein
MLFAQSICVYQSQPQVFVTLHPEEDPIYISKPQPLTKYLAGVREVNQDEECLNPQIGRAPQDSRTTALTFNLSSKTGGMKDQNQVALGVFAWEQECAHRPPVVHASIHVSVGFNSRLLCFKKTKPPARPSWSTTNGSIAATASMRRGT